MRGQKSGVRSQKIGVGIVAAVCAVIGAVAAYGQTVIRTRVPDSMVRPPVVSFTAIRVLTPQGWIYAQPDESIEIDTTASPPVIRAVAADQPAAQLREQMDRYVVRLEEERAFEMTAPVALGSVVKLYRNGLLLADPYDYSISGSTATLVEAAGQGDIIQIAYMRE